MSQSCVLKKPPIQDIRLPHVMSSDHCIRFIPPVEIGRLIRLQEPTSRHVKNVPPIYLSTTKVCCLMDGNDLTNLHSAVT